MALFRVGCWTARHLRRQSWKLHPGYPYMSGSRPGDEAAGHAWRIALLVDGDNVQPAIIPLVLAALAQYGRCVIRRVYSDWSAGSASGWRRIESSVSRCLSWLRKSTGFGCLVEAESCENIHYLRNSTPGSLSNCLKVAYSSKEKSILITGIAG